jgi:hypothetical protein
MGTDIRGHDDGADHAGTEVSLLAWGHEVFRHSERQEWFSCRYAGLRASVLRIVDVGRDGLAFADGRLLDLWIRTRTQPASTVPSCWWEFTRLN